MQTQPGARSRSREGGSELRVSSGLSAPGEMERPVGAGVGWLTEVGSTGWARARGQARAWEGGTVPGQRPLPGAGSAQNLPGSHASPPLAVPPPSCHLGSALGEEKPCRTTWASQGGAAPWGKLRPGTSTSACAVRARVEIDARGPQRKAREPSATRGVLW
nr:uncharacterized protein LOC119627728 isoform X1 [Chlorocebus sabaeus]